MSLKPLLSFSSGELDPILTDNVTLEKFNKGLATGRNVMIGKTGAIMSRFPRANFTKSRTDGEKIKIYSPPNSGILLEFGVGYYYIHYPSTVITPYPLGFVTTYTEDDLALMHFDCSKNIVYVFVAGKAMMKIDTTPDITGVPIAPADQFKIPVSPSNVTVTEHGAPTGYLVDYLVTFVINGQESEYLEGLSGGIINKPIAIGQSNTIFATWVDLAWGFVDETPTEMRVYSRPAGAGAYGLLGATSAIVYNGGTGKWEGTYEDIGSVPDFDNGTQDLITKFGLHGAEIKDLHPKTGAIYQQRLILTTEEDEEALFASRPGFHNNFYRDFPYAPDSALQFKAGTSGTAKVLRVIDHEGLVVFTSIGVYVNTGLLSVNNLALDRRAGYVIDESIPPLVVPGGLFFVDVSGSIRQLIFSQDIQTYDTVEQSIFSNHLFRDRKITSWAYQSGLVPLIIVTFSDGTFATFTYNFEQQMRAWTRHDSVYPVEQVESSGLPDFTYFVVNVNGNRYIEVSLPRRASAATRVTNPEWWMQTTSAFMDSLTSSQILFSNFLVGDDVLLLTPVTADDWEGNLTLTCGTSAIFAFSNVGDVFRFFHPVDRSSVDLEIVSKTSDNEVVVEPSSEFPSDYASGFRMYATSNTINTCLHLEGEEVSVMVDGALIASPLNDKEDYEPLVVTGGVLTLPDDMRGACIIVGRPIVADIKTLNISTVEQSPTLIESVNVNKLYIRVNETLGLYVSNEFPEEKNDEVDGSSVKEMEALDEMLVPEFADLIGNRAPKPVSKRCELTIRGTWSGQGQVAIRQVDPLHFEILSIIPDITVLSRSDR